ncbi:MAG: DUF2461 domain-containing protein [Bacteroidota bacterium]
MIQKETIQFLYDLRDNNHKEWFDANRKVYEAARKDFIAFVARIIEGIQSFDESVAESQLDPKKTMMRINRDIRFSKDKTPYNSHLFTYINPGGRKTPTAGYFFSLDPGSAFCGAGTYKPPTDTLNQIRQEIDFNPDSWLAIVDDAGLRAQFESVISSEQLSRPPKGYEKDNPLLDWLKRKDFYVKRDISDKELLDPALADRVVEDFRVGSKLVKFLNQSLIGG